MSWRRHREHHHRRRRNGPTKHHIIPKSRTHNNNLAIVPREDHENYHKLFGNMTPTEIIAHLVNHYWNGQWFWIEQSHAS